MEFKTYITQHLVKGEDLTITGRFMPVAQRNGLLNRVLSRLPA